MTDTYSLKITSEAIEIWIPDLADTDVKEVWRKVKQIVDTHLEVEE